jgi:hypothetical protein
MTKEEKDYYNRPSREQSATIAAICFAAMAIIVVIVLLAKL